MAAGARVLAAALALLAAAAAQSEEGPAWLFNLHRACVRCLCEAATGCNAAFGCVKGYCGPFKISRLYWLDAGNITLPNDDPERAGAYEDCARQYQCATRLVTSYMKNLGKNDTDGREELECKNAGQGGTSHPLQDCNSDGLINCDDFALMHFNGAWSCQQALNQSEAGRLYHARYHQCRPVDDDSDPLGRSVM